MALKRYIAALAAVALCVTTLASAPGNKASGTAGDPVVSLKYVNEVFIPKVQALAASAADGLADKHIPSALSRLSQAANLEVVTSRESFNATVDYYGYMRYLDSGHYMMTSGETITLNAGERLCMIVGAEFSIVAGSAMLYGARAAEIINVTDGTKLYAGLSAAQRNKYILASDDVAGVVSLSNGTKVNVTGKFQVLPAYSSRHTDAAFSLKTLGLMLGSNKGFELERTGTRLEGLIMFLRLLGEENAALSSNGVHPFSDVPKWAGGTADKYVAYAYQKGYTKGVSDTKFGSNSEITLEQYLTFVLRAIGYTDGRNFSWETAPADSVRLGIMDEYEKRSLLRAGFYRDGMAYVSYRALSAYTLDGGISLLDKLIYDGVVSRAAADTVRRNPPKILG